MKINGITVEHHELLGNLHVLVLPEGRTHEEIKAIIELSDVLYKKCGCATVSVLSQEERARFPADRTYVCTWDTYTYLIPEFTQFIG